MQAVRLFHSDYSRFLVVAATILLLWLVPGSMRGQSASTSPWLGTRFLIALPDTVTNDNGNTRITLNSRVELLLFSFYDANVTVTGPGGSRAVAVPSTASTSVSLYDLFPPGVTPFVDVPGVPVRKTVSVVSDVPIFLYCRFVTPFGSELFAPLPVDGWGTEYRLASLRNDFPMDVGITSGGEEGLDIDNAPVQAVVIAAEDNTQVVVETSTGLNTGKSFVLNAGEAFLLQSARPPSNLDTAARDLTGASIKADKPIAVLSGNTRTGGGIGAYVVKAPTTYNCLRNTLLEWLHPIDRLGKTFAYAPMMTEFDQTQEIIRVIAVDPGTTMLTTSFGGPPIMIEQGKYAQLSSLQWRVNGAATPFVMQTDKPAQVVAVSGSWSELIPDPAGIDYGGIKGWSPSMTLLAPMEEWITAGRIRYFDFPASVDQYAIIVAQNGAIVSLDGVVLDLAPMPNANFQWGRFRITKGGDHTFFASGGRFSGVCYGIQSGLEEYRPLRTDRKGGDPVPLHIAEYQEFVSIAWSAPLLGFTTEIDSTPDSIEITRRDFCDSTQLEVRRIVDSKDIWTLGPMTATLDPGGVNVAAEIIPIAPLGPVTGYHIRLAPVDPMQDAIGGVTIRGTGVERHIDFAYAAAMVTLPAEIDFGTGLATATEYRTPVNMTNRKPFTATVRAAVLARGGNGFTVDAGGRLPRALQSGKSVSVDVLFNGSLPGTLYRDTLLVYTDCGTYAVPLQAQTAGTPPPVPKPTITGYDWGVRPINSTNDTLSFAGNIGTRSYKIKEVRIVDNPAGAFSLVAPSHANDEVQPSDLRKLGIRFVPTASQSYSAHIVMITEDADTVQAELLGRGIDTANGGPARLEIEDIGFDSVCLGDRIDTFLVVRNPGNGPIRVIAATVLRKTNGDIIWPVPSALPRTVPAGDSIHLPLRLVPAGLGAFDILVGIDSVAGSEGVIVRITGVAVECDPPALTVNDHDFGATWITLSVAGSVTIRNIGRGDVSVLSAALQNDSENSFTYLDPVPPFVVPEGDSVIVHASFSPSTVGRKDGAILFATEIGDLRSNLTGVGTMLRIPAFIRRDYHALPGEEVEVTVELEPPTTAVYPEHLDLRVEFADDLLDPLGVKNSPGIGAPSIEIGAVSTTLDRPVGKVLDGGELMRFRFLTRFSLLTSTELPFVLRSELPYVEFDERPGLFTRDSICALQNRLFEFTRFGLFLNGPQPNPTSDQATIELEIPFEGQTTVLIYDLVGQERLRILDQFLAAGHYPILLPVGTLPPGSYIVRVHSGTYSFTRQLNVIR